jgi:hypothetical protein
MSDQWDDATISRDAMVKVDTLVTLCFDAGVRSTMNEATSKLNGAKPGFHRIAIPAGFSCLSDAVRAGIERERLGSRIEALQQCGLTSNTYLAARDIILLSERNDLSHEDMKIVRAALYEFDQSRSYKRAVSMVKPIVQKVWGRKGNRFKADKSRQEALNHTICVIQTICSATVDVVIPTMDKEQRNDMLAELNEAVSSLHALYQRVKNGG